MKTTRSTLSALVLLAAVVVLELVVYPAIYEIWKWHFGLKRQLVPATSAEIQGP